MAPCSISPNIREGLLEAFYGVYEKDSDKVDKYPRFKIISMVLCYLRCSCHGQLWFTSLRKPLP